MRRTGAMAMMQALRLSLLLLVAAPRATTAFVSPRPTASTPTTTSALRESVYGYDIMKKGFKKILVPNAKEPYVPQLDAYTEPVAAPPVQSLRAMPKAKVELPKVDLPKAPDVSLPDVSLPKVDLPSLPKLDGSGPKILEIGFPEIKVPKAYLDPTLPDFDVGSARKLLTSAGDAFPLFKLLDVVTALGRAQSGAEALAALNFAELGTFYVSAAGLFFFYSFLTTKRKPAPPPPPPPPPKKLIDLSSVSLPKVDTSSLKLPDLPKTGLTEATGLSTNALLILGGALSVSFGTLFSAASSKKAATKAAAKVVAPVPVPVPPPAPVVPVVVAPPPVPVVAPPPAPLPVPPVTESPPSVDVGAVVDTMRDNYQAAKGSAMATLPSLTDLKATLKFSELGNWYLGAGALLVVSLISNATKGMLRTPPPRAKAIDESTLTEAPRSTEMDQLMGEIADLTKSINKLSGEVKDLKVEKNSRDYEISLMKSDMSSLKNELDATKASEVSLEVALKATETQLEEETATLQRLIEITKEKLGPDWKPKEEPVVEPGAPVPAPVIETPPAAFFATVEEETPEPPTALAPKATKKATKGSAKAKADAPVPAKKATAKKAKGEKKATKKAAKKATKKSKAVPAIDDLASLSDAALKRKTVKDLTAYLESKGADTTDANGAVLKKDLLIAAIRSL